ncbi:hypothetical protein [Nocardia sp. NPDC127526]|uniref:hypothetical protein n=1 Tax=Nocardia sp. NPDC127526 TaxID=3345393 RepID=UPI00362932A4
MSNNQFGIQETWGVLDEIKDAMRNGRVRAAQAAIGRATMGGVSMEQIEDAVAYGRSKTYEWRQMVDTDDLQRSATYRVEPEPDSSASNCGTATLTVTPAANPFNRPSITPALSDVLDWVHIKAPLDDVKPDMELVCQLCGEVLADAEHDDSLGILARVALGHMHSCPGWDKHSKWPRPAAEH